MNTKKIFAGLGAVTALGAAIVPMTAYADVTNSASESVNVKLNVGSTLSMSLSGTDISAAVLTSQSSNDKTTTATVTSNSTSGYTLSATAPEDSAGALTGTDDSNNEHSIAYVGSNYSSVTEGWALSVGGAFKDISGDKISLAESSTIANNEDTTVTYNFKTNADTKPGDYATTLTYTASVK